MAKTFSIEQGVSVKKDVYMLEVMIKLYSM